MAGEKKGITYEAILYVVLERLRKKGKLKGKETWMLWFVLVAMRFFTPMKWRP